MVDETKTGSEETTTTVKTPDEITKELQKSNEEVSKENLKNKVQNASRLTQADKDYIIGLIDKEK